VASRDERVRGDHRQPVVAEAAAQSLVHALPAVEVGSDLAWEVVGPPGHLEVVAPQHVPHLGVIVDVLDPGVAEPGAELVERRLLRGARAA
jgi:hypothetical protein